MKPGATIIIVTFNSEETITDSLLSVAKTLRPEDDCIVVDNASTDQTVAVIEQMQLFLPDAIRFLTQKTNYGFSRGCNIGIEHSDKKYVILLNPDTEVFEDWIERITWHFEFYPKTGAIGGLSNNCLAVQNVITYVRDYTNNSYNSRELLDILYSKYHRRSIPMKLLMGFCLALRRDLIDKFGGLDEDIFLGDDDLEISWRLREKGYMLRLALDVFVNHVGHASFATITEKKGTELVQQGTDVLFRKMQDYYHPEKVPHPKDYFGISWWHPSELKRKYEEDLFTRNLLPCPHRQVIKQATNLLKNKRVAAAISLIEHSLKVHVNDYQAWLVLGSIYLATRNYERAEICLKNAWSMQIEDGTAKEKLCFLLEKQGKQNQINELFNTVQA